MRRTRNNRRSTEAAWVLALTMAAPALRMPAQTAATAAAPAEHAAAAQIAGFDAVSIRPNNTGSGHVSVHTNSDSYAGMNVPLKGLIEYAYDLQPDQLTGLPAWAESQHYDVVAKISEADADQLKALNQEDRRRFMQAVLTDRFHLKAHREQRTLPVYDLVAVKGGVKLHEVASAEKETPWNGVSSGGISVHNTHLIGHAVSLADFVADLSEELQRTVLDKTGLAGKYDFDLTWTREDPSAASADGSAAPPIFTAVQEQLGLKLEADKGPVNVLVIDNLDKPSEN